MWVFRKSFRGQSDLGELFETEDNTNDRNNDIRHSSNNNSFTLLVVSKDSEWSAVSLRVDTLRPYKYYIRDGRRVSPTPSANYYIFSYLQILFYVYGILIFVNHLLSSTLHFLFQLFLLFLTRSWNCTRRIIWFRLSLISFCIKTVMNHESRSVK